MKNLSFHKGFVIIEEDGVYSVHHSDIKGIIGKDRVIKHIERNLSQTGKTVGSYRGINIIRKWQNAETVERNGEVMVDNGFYYTSDDNLMGGILYKTLNDIKWAIDNKADDRDDFNKRQFPVQYKAFMKKLTF